MPSIRPGGTSSFKKLDFSPHLVHVHEPRGHVYEGQFLSFLKAGLAPIGLTPAPLVP